MTHTKANVVGLALVWAGIGVNVAAVGWELWHGDVRGAGVQSLTFLAFSLGLWIQQLVDARLVEFATREQMSAVAMQQMEEAGKVAVQMRDAAMQMHQKVQQAH